MSADRADEEDGQRRSDESGLDGDTFEALLRNVARVSGFEPMVASRFQPGTVLNERFEIEAKLGEGGMGTVYRALDRVRGMTVALKALHPRDPAAIYWLKDEFRALSDVAHRNLVSFHELVVDGDHRFLTMELVRGQRFVEYVAPRDRGADTSASHATVVHGRSSTRAPSGTQASTVAEPITQAAHAMDEAKLRSALGQLVSGVVAIHGAGKLHRDLKPANVLVATDGRVVILDFGLVRDQDDHQRRDPAGAAPSASMIAGTPMYMAPEQAAGQRATPASDWYAVGVILYECLTGRPPHDGDADDVMSRKQLYDPPRPGLLVPQLPADLESLCVDLLQRAADRRPDGAEICRRLGLDAARPSVSMRAPAQARGHELIGRADCLQQLAHAHAAVRAGAPVVVAVHGPSGIGKSRLVEHFVELIAREPDVLVLRGRCYERESVPYKALDGLIDGLGKFLNSLPDERTAQLLPDAPWDLLRAFPVLALVRAIPPPPADLLGQLDVHEARQRAFRALKQVLNRLSQSWSLVLFMDDLHWGDMDSARILLELLSPGDRPNALWLGTYRSEEAQTSPLLSELLPRLAPNQTDVDFRELALETLPEVAATALALDLMGPAVAVDEAQARRIARESGGSPFFIEALVGHRQMLGGGDSDVTGLSVEELVRARVAALPAQARRLLETIAVAGQPIEQGVALASAGIGDGVSVLLQLRAARFVRTRGNHDRDAVESYHDRIRETVVRDLHDGELTLRHAALAAALESHGRAEPELLARQYAGAGDRGRASLHALRAAELATAALAFTRAAGLYLLALECLRTDDPRTPGVRRARAVALVNGGRGAEAAAAYAEAAAHEAEAAAFELHGLSAQQYLAAGHVDTGLRVLRPLMKQVDIPYPERPDEVLRMLLSTRQELQRRGLDFAERRESELPADVLRRIEVGRLASEGLAYTDVIRSSAILLRTCVLALDCGEPRRAAWAIGQYALAGSLGAAADGTPPMALVDRAEAIALREGDDDTRGLLLLTRARLALGAHRWDLALNLSDACVDFVSEHCPGGWRVVVVAKNVALYALLALGRIDELAKRSAIYQRRAIDVGDLYGHITTCFYTAIGRLAQNDVEGCRDHLNYTLEVWAHASFLFQDWLLLQGRVLCDLYEGHVEQGWRRLDEGWSRLSNAHLLVLSVVHVPAYRLRGNLALALLDLRPELATTARAEVVRCIDQLGSTESLFARAAALALRGALAQKDGASDVARARLEEAEAAYRRAAMPLDAAAISARIGELDAVGERARVEQSHRAMADSGIAAPERWIALLAPPVNS